jgi:hypothetical protein
MFRISIVEETFEPEIDNGPDQPGRPAMTMQTEIYAQRVHFTNVSAIVEVVNAHDRPLPPPPERQLRQPQADAAARAAVTRDEGYKISGAKK